MANRLRGETAAMLGGRVYRLRLTMDGLAELQEFLGAGDLIDLGRRLSESATCLQTAAAVVAAGLRGASAEASETVPAGTSWAELEAAAKGVVEAAFGRPGGAPRAGVRVRAEIARAFAFAVRQAGVPPSEFWRLSLPEFVALFTANSPADERPDAATLGELAAMFPDRKD